MIPDLWFKMFWIELNINWKRIDFYNIRSKDNWTYRNASQNSTLYSSFIISFIFNYTPEQKYELKSRIKRKREKGSLLFSWGYKSKQNDIFFESLNFSHFLRS